MTTLTVPSCALVAPARKCFSMAQPERLSLVEARRAALSAQGLSGPRARGGPKARLHRLRAVQLDTISVLARSHELVAYARLGPLKRTVIERAYWSRQPHNAFEYWAHAACVLPMEDWPNYGWRRQATRDRGRRWHWLENAARTCPEVLARLESEGPLTANQLGGAKRGGVWWDWSETKIAVEWLLDVGEVVCTQRRGFQRVYDLPHRAVPSELLDVERAPDDQRRTLLGGAAAALGVATLKDLSAYTGVKAADVRRLVGDLGLLPVEVEGWDKATWAASPALEAKPAARRGPVMLSPFDSLVWERERVERLFGFFYRLEAYTPKSKRIWGYCCLPVLAGDAIIGKVDPGREGSLLVAKGVHLEPAAVRTPAAAKAAAKATARAMWEAASWVDCDGVRVDWVTPADVRTSMLEAVKLTRP